MLIVADNLVVCFARMSETDRSSQVTLVGSQSNTIIFGCYSVDSSKTSATKCADVPDRTSQVAQAYKAYQFQIKSVKQKEYLMLDVTEDALGYIFAAGDGHCWHMRTLDNDKDQKECLQRFVSFTAKHSIFIARHELVNATIRTFSTQKKILLEHNQTYLGCVTNTKVLSFNLLLQQICISDHLIMYLISQAFYILKVLKAEKVSMFKGELINHLHVWSSEAQIYAARLGSCTNGCNIPTYRNQDETDDIFDDFLKTMIELKPNMTNLIKSQQELRLNELKKPRESIDTSKVQEQLKELFATSVIVTVEHKTLQTASNKRPL